MSEQTRAREQARLLSRFQELRAWQLNQQELLMKQQQLQMSQLHAEQQRIQDMLVQQRQQQWGSDSAQGMEVVCQNLCINSNFYYYITISLIRVIL